MLNGDEKLLLMWQISSRGGLVHVMNIVPLLLPSLQAKEVFAPFPPDRGYFVPSHFFDIMLFYLVLLIK